MKTQLSTKVGRSVRGSVVVMSGSCLLHGSSAEGAMKTQLSTEVGGIPSIRGSVLPMSLARGHVCWVVGGSLNNDGLEILLLLARESYY
jgi:hypothetical protein